MRISDWSSDMCSSDLVEVEEIAVFADPADAEDAIADAELLQELAGRLSGGGLVVVLQHAAGKNDLKLALAVEDGGNRQVVGHHGQAAVIQQRQIGRASCRERVCTSV